MVLLVQNKVLTLISGHYHEVAGSDSPSLDMSYLVATYFLSRWAQQHNVSARNYFIYFFTSYLQEGVCFPVGAHFFGLHLQATKTTDKNI